MVERVEKVLNLALQGKTARAIAQELGVCPRTIYRIRSSPEYRAAQENSFGGVRRELAGAQLRAIETLNAILKEASGDPKAKIAASRVLLAGLSVTETTEESKGRA